MKPAILYAAKSTNDEHGSIPDQLADGRKLAADGGFEVVAECHDEAKSAYHGNRGDGLAAAMAECERLSVEHGACVLIVQRSDRLARGDVKKARHLTQIVTWAIEHDVGLLSVQDPSTFPDCADPNMKVLLGAIGGMSGNQESEKRGQSVKKGLRRRVVERRQYIGGRRPFGYRYEAWIDDSGERQSRLVIDPAEATIVRRIFAEYVAGRAQNAIAQSLQGEGVPTLTAGGEWYATTVAGMLKNPLYIGMAAHNGEHYPAEHEAIVDPATWGRATELREARHAQGPPRGRRTTGRHLLTEGLLSCPLCASSMSPVTKHDRRAANGQPYETYVCVKRLHHGPSACAQKPIKRAVIDVAVYDYFEGAALDVDATRDLLVKQVGKSLGEADGLCLQAERELAQTEAALERIEGDYVAGLITAEQWSRLGDRLHGEAGAARAQVEQHGRRQGAVEAAIGEFDAQVVIAKELAAIRRQIVGEVQEGKEGDLERFRSTLRRLFVVFELATTDDGGYLLMPGPRVARTGGRWDFEAAGRGALDFSDNLYSLLAAW
jgi:DNA invertase Pin-like site-specific DNA recombinase